MTLKHCCKETHKMFLNLHFLRFQNLKEQYDLKTVQIKISNMVDPQAQAEICTKTFNKT